MMDCFSSRVLSLMRPRNPTNQITHHYKDFAPLETLGIPETDTRIPTLSYAVTSPDVTIAALGIAVVLTGYMWWSVWNHGRHQTSWKRGISGLLLLVVGGFGTGLSLSLGIILAEGLGQVGIWWAISFFIYVLGWALLSVPFGSGVCSDSDCPENPESKRNRYPQICQARRRPFSSSAP